MTTIVYYQSGTLVLKDPDAALTPPAPFRWIKGHWRCASGFESRVSAIPSRAGMLSRKRPSHPKKQRGLWARCGVRHLVPAYRDETLTRTLCGVRGAPRGRGAASPSGV
jgi:hypothetical protein